MLIEGDDTQYVRERDGGEGQRAENATPAATETEIPLGNSTPFNHAIVVPRFQCSSRPSEQHKVLRKDRQMSTFAKRIANMCEVRIYRSLSCRSFLSI